MATGELGIKFSWAASEWPALISGTVSRAEELLATYRNYLQEVKLGDHNIFDEMKKPALLHKEKLADEYIRSKFGFSYEHLRKHGKRELPASLLYESFTDVKNLDLGCSVLIAGFLDTTPYLFIVSADATVAEHEHFGAIGTGSVIAESALYQRGQSPTKQLEETIYCVYEAKRLSEIAEGVGSQTSLMIIEPDATETTHGLRARTLNEEGFKRVRAIYDSQGFRQALPKWDTNDAFRVVGGDKSVSA